MFIFPLRNNLRFGHTEELETHAKLHTCILPTKWKRKKERKKEERKNSIRNDYLAYRNA